MSDFIQEILNKDPADWTDEEQIAVIEQTDNRVDESDSDLEQPPQNPVTYGD